MWTKSYTKTFKAVTKEEIWDLWADVNQWHRWNPGIEFSTLQGLFEAGNFLVLKPKGMPSVRIQLMEVVKNKSYRDCTKFPGAKMYGFHEMEETEEGLKLTTTMTVSGFLSFLWIRLVARGVVDKVPEQTDALVSLARENKNS